MSICLVIHKSNPTRETWRCREIRRRISFFVAERTFCSRKSACRPAILHDCGNRAASLLTSAILCKASLLNFAGHHSALPCLYFADQRSVAVFDDPFVPAPAINQAVDACQRLLTRSCGKLLSAFRTPRRRATNPVPQHLTATKSATAMVHRLQVAVRGCRKGGN